MTVAPADTVTFLLTPLREGRRLPCGQTRRPAYFYSRPCGRGDGGGARAAHGDVVISTHAPAGGATFTPLMYLSKYVFLLTPLREGRRDPRGSWARPAPYFYSRPCGRGDTCTYVYLFSLCNFYSRPCGRGD